YYEALSLDLPVGTYIVNGWVDFSPAGYYIATMKAGTATATFNGASELNALSTVVQISAYAATTITLAGVIAVVTVAGTIEIGGSCYSNSNEDILGTAALSFYQGSTTLSAVKIG
ncbi:MAG: hypothetical protein ACRD22_12695, partial [Terriglobia bacterium]